MAPTGQPYYFNAATGQSTHEHPLNFGAAAAAGPSNPAVASAPPPAMKPKKEKPKQKSPIPGAPGWLRVTTNLGNVFYTHTESKRSEWVVPDEIKDAVSQMDKRESEVQQEYAQRTEDEAAQAVKNATSASDGKRKRQEDGEKEEREEQQQKARSSTPADGSGQEAAPVSVDVTGEGIDAAELLATSARPDSDDDDEHEEGASESARLVKKQRISERPAIEAGKESAEEGDDDGDDDDDEDEEWQRQVAAEMAAEAETQEQTQANPPPRPSAPPQPPLPVPASINAASPHILPPPGGYSGPPPGFPQQGAIPAPAPPPTLSLEEGRALFMRMLTSLNGTKEEVSPMAPWDKELPKFVHRSEYASLKQLKDRQDAFNDWCRDRLREKRQMKSKAAATATSSSHALEGSSSLSESSTSPQEAYAKLLHAEVKSTRARFEDFKKDFKKDRRFYGFGRDDREREKRFKTHLRELGEQKRKAAEEAEQKFIATLDSEIGRSKRADWHHLPSEKLKNDVWREAKKTCNLESRKEYDAVGSSSRRAELFVQWVRDVDREKRTSNGDSATAGSEGSDAQARRERALREREEQVQRQRQDTERQNRRALGAAKREEGTIRFGELLVDAVRDALTTWDEATEDLRGDPRFEAEGLQLGQKRQMFEDHIHRLSEKKRGQLDKIFASHGPNLDVSDEVVIPLVKDDAEYERLGLERFVRGLRRTSETAALQEEFGRWQRERHDRARRDFDQMLKESSFVDFWGRLRSEASSKKEGEDAAAERALKQNEAAGDFAGEEDEEGGVSNLVEMAGRIDIEQIHSVLRNDQRYRVWKHEPELRDKWIRVSERGMQNEGANDG